MRNQLISILEKGSFQLRKWASNEPSLLSGLDNSNDKHMIIEFDAHDQLKTLGIHWDAVRDTLGYKTSIRKIDRPTKRSILSRIASIFDPLGLIGPIVVRGKLIIQELWKADVSWDAEIPQNIQIEWEQLVSELPSLEAITIPRNIITDLVNSRQLELHGFADASKRAYGAAIYIRSFSNTLCSCNLLCSRSRVSPIKAMTIPRLELCAAQLLSKLMNKTLMKINLNFQNVYYWSDSSIVLAWIRSDSSKYKTFVATRISEIQELTRKNQWFHISTKENPADVLSRGCPIDALKDNKLWWHGPSWLRLETSRWPIALNNTENSYLTDELITTSFVATTKPQMNIIDRFSSYNRLIRVMSYCRRFLNKKLKGPLTTNELEDTVQCLVKMIQKLHFPVELNDLKLYKSVRKQSPLAKLNPFLDGELIR